MGDPWRQKNNMGNKCPHLWAGEEALDGSLLKRDPTQNKNTFSDSEEN